jgi:hypothetical protein
MFADDAPTWQVTVTNAGGAELRGALALRSDKDPTCTAVLAADLHLANGAQASSSAPLPPLPPGDQKLQVVLRDPAGQEQVLGSLPVTVFDQLHPVPGLNLVRNASFELGAWFSGTPMREGAAFFQRFVKTNGQGVAGPGDPKRWVATDAEGWWAEGPSAEGVVVATGAAHSGSHSLRVQAVEGQRQAVESALNRMVPAGPVTLSAWVKTRGCTGRLDLDLDAGSGMSGWESVLTPTVRQSLTLPADSDWTRLTVTATAPSLLQTLARLQVDQGTAWLDDVQIEAAPTASAFNVRPEEWLRLSLAGVDEAVLAKWVRGDKTLRTVTVYNDSRAPLTGTVHLRMGAWDHPAAHELGTLTLRPGVASYSLTFATGDLPVDAYVVSLTLEDQGQVLASGLRDFNPEEHIGTPVANGDLRARTAIRFALAPDTPPARIFGIGNTMLETTADWFVGWTLAGYAEARPLGFTTCRSTNGTPEDIDEKTYLAAAAGVSMAISDQFLDATPAGEEVLANPAYPQALDLSNPKAWAVFLQQAAETARTYAANPFIVDPQLANESPYPNTGHLCPSTYADADFRAWCEKRYGNDLSALNGHWGTSFTSWDQVEQIASASYAAEVKQAPVKQGAAAVDWRANTGTFSGAVVARMHQHPGWSMDWVRWWTDLSLRMFFAFRDRAHQFDHKTLYSNNLCWPAFWPQMYMPFVRGMDHAELDIHYTSGLRLALGTPAEMMDSLEMTESTVPGKPIWGQEVYYQPQWPPEFIALQSWGVLAHGMTNDMTFAWRPYADYGPVVGTRAWEKPDALPMWFIIDNDGTKLPAYPIYLRCMQEIRDFHQRFDGFSLKRAATTVGFYVSPDTGSFVLYDTGNQPWLSPWEHTRNTLVYALRMEGVTVTYLDDATLPAAPGPLQTIIVPAAYVLSQPAAEKLAAFAQAGGTVILAGMTGVVDPWLAKYPNIGGPAWADLNWQAPDFNLDPAHPVFAAASAGSPGLFRGAGLGIMPGATPIMGPGGDTLGWERTWGTGKLLAYGIVPEAYTTDPHASAEMSAWLDQWRLYVDLPITGRWVSGDALKMGLVGEGSEVVEVVVREKSPTEKFVFCLNQGGAGRGTVEVPVSGGTWRALDALTGDPVAGAVAAGTWRTPLSLDALGYRVIRLAKQ